MAPEHPFLFHHSRNTFSNLTANSRCLLRVSLSLETISLFEAKTSAFSTKHNNQSHRNCSSYLFRLPYQPRLDLLSLTAYLMFCLYMTHCLKDCTRPRGNAYVESLTSDPEQKQDFFDTGRQTQRFALRIIYLCRRRDTFRT